MYSAGDRFRLQTVSGGVVHIQLGEANTCIKVMKEPETSAVPATLLLHTKRPQQSTFALSCLQLHT